MCPTFSSIVPVVPPAATIVPDAWEAGTWELLGVLLAIATAEKLT
jgi:hypothetical protein